MTPLNAVIGDLTVADRVHDRVDEDQRVDPLQRPVRPPGHLPHDSLGDPGRPGPCRPWRPTSRRRARTAPRGQPTGCQRQHDLVDPARRPFPGLRTITRLERPVPGPSAPRRALGPSRSGPHTPGAVAGVLLVAPDRTVLGVAQGGRHLLLQRCPTPSWSTRSAARRPLSTGPVEEPGWRSGAPAHGREPASDQWLSSWARTCPSRSCLPPSAPGVCRPDRR